MADKRADDMSHEMPDGELGALLTLARSAQRHALPADPRLVRTSGTQRRRRRTVAASVIAAALVFGGVGTTLAVTSHDDGGDRGQVVNTSDVLGPDGYGDLLLGMSREEAESTGVVDIGDGAPGATCRDMALTGHPPARNTTSGFYSENVGVAMIFAADDMETPEGIGLGSTLEELRAAYPQAGKEMAGWYVTVPGHPDKMYYFGVAGGAVESLAVQLKTADCTS